MSSATYLSNLIRNDFSYVSNRRCLRVDRWICSGGTHQGKMLAADMGLHRMSS